jgi:hypothetical protein
LRNGFGQVVSVDIDPTIIDIGRRLHPEHPYSDPRAVPVVNDARAYLEQHSDERFDVVCFGLLDSHAMFSSMASLRLDNYVYTVESMRSAWRHVAPGGALSVSFSVYAGEWIADRIFAVLTEATGQKPRVFAFSAMGARTFIVTKGQTRLPARLVDFESPMATDLETTRVTTDDWPFLYLRPNTFPAGYMTMLACILVFAVAGARIAFGKRLYGGGFDPVLFLMGAAFLLIETRGVTDLGVCRSAGDGIGSESGGTAIPSARSDTVLCGAFRGAADQLSRTAVATPVAFASGTRPCRRIAERAADRLRGRHLFNAAVQV